MKKILLIAILISSISFSQQKKYQIESITDVIIDENSSTTTYYKFENGKLASKEEQGKKPVYYTYNQNGLLEKVSNTYNDGDMFDDFYTYNKDGYIIEILNTGKKVGETEFKPLSKKTILYEIKDANNFKFNDSWRYVHNNKYVNERIYEMKDNVLKLSKNTSEYKYKMENGNVVSLAQLKPSREKHSVDYKFDSKPSINKMMCESMYGDKYFINSLISLSPFYDYYSDFVNQNTCIGNKNVDQNFPVSEYTSVITYNEENLPVEIKTEKINPGFIKTVKITYKK